MLMKFEKFIKKYKNFSRNILKFERLIANLIKGLHFPKK